MKPVYLICAAGVAAMGAAMPAQAQDRYLGDIFIAGYTFCPRGTTAAEGQLLPISSNTALFSLYGTTYGGDGRTTFQLPDLRSRSPVGQGPGPGLTNYPQGARGGVENITLTVNTMPRHSHDGRVRASTQAPNAMSPTGNNFATLPQNAYTTGAGDTTMRDDAVQIGPVGGGQPFDNRNPFLSLRYCVVLQGIFPSRN